MLQAEQLPTSVTNLDACLTKVKAKGLTHGFLFDCGWEELLQSALKVLTKEVNTSQISGTKSTA
jgi:hypothetical protein